MKHSDSGIEPHELAAPLIQQHKDVSFILANKVVAESPPASPPPSLLPVAATVPAVGEKRGKRVLLQVLVFTSLWWSAAILVIVDIKRTVSSEGVFPHPFALTSISQPCTALAAFLLSRVVYSKRRRAARPPLTWRESLMLLVFGLIQGFEIGLTNKALGYLTVAARTMISSTNVLFMMATAKIWGLEGLGWLRIISALLLILGGSSQGYGQVGQDHSGGSLRLVGIAMQCASMLLSAQRWALAQFVMQRSPPDSGLGRLTKLELLSRTLPVTGIVCIPLALAFEPHAYTMDQLLQRELWLRVVIVAASLTAMLYAELKLVNLLSAVAFNVLATIHQIPIVLAGVVLQHNQVDPTSAYGFAVCLVGALVYAAARNADRVHAEA